MILVFGSLNVDVMIAVKHLPLPGETVLGPGYELTAGGKGANQALAAARAGGKVVMVGSIGGDPLAATAIADLQAAGVDLSRLARVADPTGLAAICVDQAGENHVVVASGANRRTTAAQVPDALLGPDTVLVLQMEVPLAENWALIARAEARGARIILNLAPAGAVTRAALGNVDWLIVNENEAKQVAGHLGLDVPARAHDAAKMLARECDTTVIVTLGAAGAAAFLPGGSGFSVPALPIKPVDTVGAGDSFVGSFAAAIDRGLGLPEALRYAATGGALACLKTGAQPSLPTRAEIEARLPELPAAQAI
ncbi:ribokinase [Dongia mobilis]|uniref:Ribokinase n=1 Tax=Dongia mobilis TaxID=578943 RepID=A0A4R6WRJ4_9PROT|nr:ribokinase [Dongia mobilis]TDQ84215.1 ribokinase [Dongia mobilis]